MNHGSVASILNPFDLGALSSICYLISSHVQYLSRCLECSLVADLIGSASSSLIVNELGTWSKAKEGKKRHQLQGI